MKVTFALCTLLLGACAPDSVLLVELRDAEPIDALVDAASDAELLDANGSEEAGPKSCKGNAECAIDELCAMNSCDASQGTCRPRPFCDDEERVPVCGCDGMIYFTDCLRRQERIVATKPLSQCRTPCTTDRDCPVNARCGRVFPDWQLCSDTRQGVCWRLPSECGSNTRARYESCNGAADRCETLCRAVASGDPYYLSFGDSCASPRM